MPPSTSGGVGDAVDVGAGDGDEGAALGEGEGEGAWASAGTRKLTAAKVAKIAAPNRVSMRLECSAPFAAAVSAERIIRMVDGKEVCDD